MTEDDLDLIHSRMQSMLGELAVDRIYACVDPAGSPRRKPNPTMVFEAQEDLNLDLGQSWFVGDTDGDMQCAKAAGVGAIRVLLPGRTIREEADFEIASVAELAELLDRILRPLV
jgi:D-glycero-D-manno-heptose 1,7-bisphosphate phosphatase